MLAWLRPPSHRAAAASDAPRKQVQQEEPASVPVEEDPPSPLQGRPPVKQQQRLPDHP